MKKTIYKIKIIYILIFTYAINLVLKYNLISEELRDNDYQTIVTLNDQRSDLLNFVEKKYKLKIKNQIQGTVAISLLNETIWILNLIASEQIKNYDDLKYILYKINDILINLKRIKEENLSFSKWQVTLNDLDDKFLPTLKHEFTAKNEAYFSKNKISTLIQKKEKLKFLIEKTKKQISNSFNSELDKIEQSYFNLDKQIGIDKSPPNRLKKILFDLNINYMVLMIVNRGILNPNATWFKINDLLLKDKSGVTFYEKLKKEFGKPIMTIHVLMKPIHLVSDPNFIKQILDQSPYVFGVGIYKKHIFKSFMEHNVGISEDKAWHNRRKLNDAVLCENNLHRYAKYYNQHIKEILKKNGVPKDFDAFLTIGKKIISKVIFNVEQAPEYIFDIFTKANSIKSLTNKNFHIDDSTMDAYLKYLNKHIENPNPNSLVESAVKYIDYCPSSNSCKKEILFQIPHWIFPSLGGFMAIIPRTLLFLYNHPKDFELVVDEIKNIDINDERQIYNLKHTRKCILESLRLNNAVVTLFRTLKKDYNFGNDSLGKEYKFKKGEQFLILTNPVLREPERFEEPNKFKPSRWTPELENSYYSLMFSQGPQKCPGKELAIFLMQSYLANYLKESNYELKSDSINTEYIEQMINPFTIRFY